MNELISVIVPIYKVEDYLKRCVESLLNQTYQNYEIILVDDGSPDNCPEICDQYAHDYEKIQVVHKINGGLSDARNAGYDIAKGEYICFVDSDDWVHKDYLKNMYDAMIEKNADVCESNICVTDQYVLDDSDNSITIDEYTASDAIKLLINDQVFHQYVWNKMYKREAINNFLFPKGKTNEDEFWTYKVFGNSHKVIKISSVLYYYFQRNTSIMGVGYNTKRLDALEAKFERNTYIKNMYPELYSIANVNLYSSCIFAGQMTLKYLQGENKKYAKDTINKYLKEIKINNEDLKTVGGTSKLYIQLAKISFWNLCKLKNMLGKGL